MVEERICELYPEKEIRCPVHLCIGQEAVAAGVCANLKVGDYVLSNHRSHGHYLAKGGDLKAMMAEIYGKSTGCSLGKGGSMHLVDLKVNFLGSTPIVAGMIPVATGVAFGTLMQKKNEVTAVFFGDAATEEGVFAEALNFAALKKLPIVFICENNLYSVYSPLSVRQPKERSNLKIARGFGVYAEGGDGNDALMVYRCAQKAVRHARSGKGPVFLEFDTYRYREHCGHNFDNNLGYRSEEEFRSWQERCPLDTLGKKLIHNGLLNERSLAAMKAKISGEIDAAVAFARRSPFPKKREVSSDLYA